MMNQKIIPGGVIKNEPKTPVQSLVKPDPSAAGDKDNKPKTGFRGLQLHGPPKGPPPKDQSRVNRFAGGGGPNERGQGQQTVGSLKRSLPSRESSEKELGASDGNGKELSADVSGQKEKKFTGRCRLFVGNLPGDMSEDEFTKLFEPYGEFSEVFLNAGRGFGFIRMDTRHHAEDARKGVDGTVFRGRPLRVRLAAHSAALRVKYLSQHVSNEMLAEAFSIFGDIERAIVIVDDRGKPTGEGIVEFARKPGAMTALKRISEGVFLLTRSPRPIAVELLEQVDETDGLPELFFQKSGDLMKEREQAPRFAQPGSFEYEFGLKWKTLYQLLYEQQEALKKNFEEEVTKMELDMETAIMEQHTALLRQDLMRRQEELQRLEEQTQMEVKRRLEARRHEDDRRRTNSADVFHDFRRTAKSQEDELFGGSMERRTGFLGLGQSPSLQEGGRRLPAPALPKQTQAPNSGHMMSAPPGLSRNERGPGLAAPPVMNRVVDRPGLVGMAPPLQPPPVPPGVDRSRMITTAQQISKLISPLMQPNPRARFEHPQQGLQGPGGHMRPGGPSGFENPRMGVPGGQDDHFDPKRMRRF